MSDKNTAKENKDIEELKKAFEAWLKTKPDVPSFVIEMLGEHFKLLSTLKEKSARQRALLKQLLKEYGIQAKSERSKTGKRSSRQRKPKTREEAAGLIDKSRSRAREHEKLAKRHRRKAEALEKLPSETEAQIEAQEEAEAEALVEQLDKDCQVGSRCDIELAKPSEDMMQGVGANYYEEDVVCSLDTDTRNKAKRIFTKERVRYDLSINLTRMNLEVEHAEIKTSQGTSILAASTDSYGPPKTQVTWGFVSTVIVLASQYAMPFNRLSSLVSLPEKSFSSADLSRYFSMSAKKMVWVYLHLGRQLIGSDVLMGDDTSNRTIEVESFLKDEEGEKPWADYATTADAKKSIEQQSPAPSLCLETSAVLGFESKRRTDGKSKKSLNVSVLSGRVDDDPSSYIIFYRTHLGSLGNLIESLLPFRPAEKKKLVLHADLSSSNKAITDDFDIEYSGCVAHARRRFVTCIDSDLYAKSLVHHFDMLFHYETMIDTYGRNRENTLQVRANHSKRIWDIILEDCDILAKKWSRKTVLGEAARYVLNHKQELLYYLTDPRVALHNNFSERMLRPEKLIQKNAMFRKSIEGRIALDISRSILQTALACKVDPCEYMDWLLRFDEKEIKENPEKFTPRAYSFSDTRPQH